MIIIRKIVYFYEDGSKKIERPGYTEVATKTQLEKLRRILIKNNECQNITFIYEEHYGNRK